MSHMITNVAEKNFRAVGSFMEKTVRVTIRFFVIPVQFMITQTAINKIAANYSPSLRIAKK